MKAIKVYQNIIERLSNLSDLPLLFFRIVLAYGFYGPATMKWGNINGIAEWFGSMGIPMPTLNAYLTASTEMAAVILLPLGLATRFISIPLMFTMLVAIVTVHGVNGFNAGDNGYEIPLYYLLMLLALLINGPGKLSIDNLIRRRVKS
nr:DoxX family protein [Bacteroidota bacterium]